MPNMENDWQLPPAPTPAPAAELVQQRLEKRQNGLPATCGWITGDSNSPVTCAAGYTCAIDTVHSVHGCCTNDVSIPCTVYTTCYDYGAGQTLSGYTLQCPSQIPSCYTRYWDTNPPLSGFGCAPAAFVVQGVRTTYNGEFQQGIASVPNPTPAASLATTLSSTAPSSSAASTPSTLLSLTQSLTTSPTPSSAPSQTTPSASSAPSSSPQSPTPSTLSAGAIAGIVLGGVIGIAILVYFVGREISKHKERATDDLKDEWTSEALRRYGGEKPRAPVSENGMTALSGVSGDGKASAGGTVLNARSALGQPRGV